MNFLIKLALGFSLIPFAAGICQDAAKDPLQTKVYHVPPSFPDSFFRNWSDSAAVADPFADPVAESSPGLGKTVKENLEVLGVSFGEGASAEFDEKALRLTVTNTADQIELVEAYLDNIRIESEKQIHIYLEYIEVDHAEFSDWLFEHVMENDGTELRNEVQKWIKAGRAEIIESSTVTARSGQRAKTESVDEYVYPTEYDPAKIPGEVTLKDGAEAPITAVTPTAFETRNLGSTLEVDPVLGADDYTIDLNLSPEIVELEKVEQWHHRAVDPKFMTHMPVFYIQKITTQVTGVDGRYIFLGTTRPLKAANPERKNPLVLQFVRGDVSALGDWSEVKP